MKKTIIFILVLFFGKMFLSAQKNTWTIGLQTGLRTEIVKIEHIRYDGEYDNSTDLSESYVHRCTQSRISIPPIELNIAYNFANNFSLSSGLIFEQHVMKVIPHIGSYYDNEFRKKTSSVSNMLQIPFIVGYDIPVKNTGLSFFARLGLSMDFEIGLGKTTGKISQFFPAIDFYELEDGIYKAYDLYSTALIRSNDVIVDLLFNAGTGISYRLKSGIGFSLSIKYNTGFFRVKELFFRSQIKEIGTDILRYEEIDKLLSRNEYWNVLFGISYTFKQKKKE